MSIACLHENLGKSIAWKELVTHHPLAHVCPITLHEEVGVTQGGYEGGRAGFAMVVRVRRGQGGFRHGMARGEYKFSYIRGL